MKLEMYFLELDKTICDLHTSKHLVSGISTTKLNQLQWLLQLQQVGGNELFMAFQVICVGEYNDTLIMGILARMCFDGVYCVCMYASCEGRCVRACVLPIFPHLHANIHTTTRTHTNTHTHGHTHTCTCSHTHMTTQPCAYIQKTTVLLELQDFAVQLHFEISLSNC